MIEFKPDTSETRYKFNQLARHQLLERIEKEILFDIEVCKIEGWNKTEFIEMIRNLINNIGGNYVHIGTGH